MGIFFHYTTILKTNQSYRYENCYNYFGEKSDAVLKKLFYGEENSKNYCVVYALTNVWLELLQWIVFLSGNVKRPLQNDCILQRPFCLKWLDFGIIGRG